jgi:hypothetical protein
LATLTLKLTSAMTMGLGGILQTFMREMEHVGRSSYSLIVALDPTPQRF